MNQYMWSIVGMILAGEKKGSTQIKTCPGDILSDIKFWAPAVRNRELGDMKSGSVAHLKKMKDE